MGGRSGQSTDSGSGGEQSTYDLNNPISTYQGTWSESINNELRNGGTNRHEELIKKLDNISVDKTSDVYYRGASGSFNKVLKDQYGIKRGDNIETIKGKLVGKTFTDKGFLSTTKSVQIANQRAKNTKQGKGVLFVFNGEKTGINVEKRVQGLMSGIEQEFIIKRGAKMKITDAKYSQKTNRLIIYLES